MRHIEEERLARVLADELRRPLVDEIGEVALDLGGLQAVAERVGAVEIGVRVVVGVAEKLAEILVEAAARGVVFVAIPEVPFAKGAGRVARGLERLRERGHGSR